MNRINVIKDDGSIVSRPMKVREELMHEENIKRRDKALAMLQKERDKILEDARTIRLSW